MSPCRLPLCWPLVIALFGLWPVAAPAQLKDAQDKGWSVLKDGYALVVSMRDSKSNRTRANFDTALGKILSAMGDMKPLIERMGERVADEDRSYAAGLRDNILSAWRGVAEAHEKARRTADAVKDSPEKLAEISDELDKLKAALEQYEIACRAAFLNYKARWEDIKNSMDRGDADFKAAREKANALTRQDDALLKETRAIWAEIEKTIEERGKLQRAALEIAGEREGLPERAHRAYTSGRFDEYNRAAADYRRSCERTEQILNFQVANSEKLNRLDDDLWAKEKERLKLAREIKPAVDQMEKLAPLKLLQRYSLWDAEFPARSYSFQTLR